MPAIKLKNENKKQDSIIIVNNENNIYEKIKVKKHVDLNGAGKIVRFMN